MLSKSVETAEDYHLLLAQAHSLEADCAAYAALSQQLQAEKTRVQQDTQVFKRVSAQLEWEAVVAYSQSLLPPQTLPKAAPLLECLQGVLSHIQDLTNKCAQLEQEQETLTATLRHQRSSNRTGAQFTAMQNKYGRPS